MFRYLHSFWLLIFIPVLLMSHAASAEWYSDEQEKMGTRVEVQLWLEDETVGDIPAYAFTLHRLLGLPAARYHSENPHDHHSYTSQ